MGTREMTRERKSTACACGAKESDGELSRAEGAKHERQEKELESRIQCALEEVYEALLEAGSIDGADASFFDLELASELIH